MAPVQSTLTNGTTALEGLSGVTITSVAPTSPVPGTHQAGMSRNLTTGTPLGGGASGTFGVKVSLALHCSILARDQYVCYILSIGEGGELQFDLIGKSQATEFGVSSSPALRKC